VRATLTRPGLIVVDASLRVVANNGEALQILTYPDTPEKIRHLDTWLTNKIHSELVGKQNPPSFVEAFRSARRTYLCRSFPLDLRNQNGNGNSHAASSHAVASQSAASQSSGLLIVILERKSNDTAKIDEISERFGLTAREKETVEYLLQGLTSKEIAQRMKISPNTVKAFLRLVMVKMDVSTRSGIIGRIVGPAA
jgi:DNA-binding CsgD family transcriptional regulator